MQNFALHILLPNVCKLRWKKQYFDERNKKLILPSNLGFFGSSAISSAIFLFSKEDKKLNLILENYDI